MIIVIIHSCYCFRNSMEIHKNLTTKLNHKQQLKILSEMTPFSSVVFDSYQSMTLEIKVSVSSIVIKKRFLFYEKNNN